MIIKIIPETQAEKEKIQEAEHHNVREFLIFGNKKDADGELIDFHDWSGSYRYLLGSIHYFSNFIAGEQNSKSGRGPELQLQPKMASQPPQLIKKGETEGPLQVVEVDGDATKEAPSLKIVGKDEKAEEVVEVEEVKEAIEKPEKEPKK